MRICGVELSGSDANICLLNKDGQLFDIPDCRVRKLTLPKNHNRNDLQYFQTTFAKLLEDYKVDKVAVKERLTKGKFAGGAVSFKLEAAIQLIDAANVVLVSATDVKTAISDNPLPVAFSDTGLKAFQETAFNTAYAAQHLA